MEIQRDAPIFLALVVRDLDRSIGFYRDVLGMEEIKRVEVSDEKAATGGFAKRGFRFRTFRMGRWRSSWCRSRAWPGWCSSTIPTGTCSSSTAI